MNAETLPSLIWSVRNDNIFPTAEAKYFDNKSVKIWNKIKKDTINALDKAQSIDVFENKCLKNDLWTEAWAMFKDNYEKYLKWYKNAVHPSVLYESQIYTKHKCIPHALRHKADEYRAERSNPDNWNDSVMSKKYKEPSTPKKDNKWQ